MNRQHHGPGGGAGGGAGKKSSMRHCSTFIIVIFTVGLSQMYVLHQVEILRGVLRGIVSDSLHGELQNLREVVTDSVHDELRALRDDPTFSAPAAARGNRTREAVYAMPQLWCPHRTTDKVDFTEKTLSLIPSGQIVIDVGAYDGSNAISMARAGHRVLSFEPTPSKVEKIKRNIAAAEKKGLKGKIRFFPYAASNFSGEASFIINAPVVARNGNWVVDRNVDTSNVANLGSEQDGFAVPWDRRNSATVQVKVEKLDNMVPAGQAVLFIKVLFMKVDAQGHDFRVLQGATKLLTEQRVLVLLVEFAPTLMPGGWQEGVQMLQFLAAKGYMCFACGTTWPLGMEQGLPVGFEDWAKHVKKQTFVHRGANHGQWDDLVCLSQGARRGPLR